MYFHRVSSLVTVPPQSSGIHQHIPFGGGKVSMFTLVRRYGAFLCILGLFGCGDVDEEYLDDSYSEEADLEVGEYAATAQQIAWWQGLTQQQRNQAIVNQAVRQVNVNVGQNCKVWVQQTVVPRASQTVATVPATCPNATGWFWCAGGNAVRLAQDIRNAPVGAIVQMRVRYANGTYGPHTAIIESKTADGINWIESNWRLDNTVRRRSQTYASFLNSVTEGGQLKYSVYQIGP